VAARVRLPVTADPSWPSPADFASPPTPADRARWEEADRAARPRRLERLRARIAADGVDAYFGLRVEHMRYLTGFTIGLTEGAGDSGKFLVNPNEVVLLADSRYTIQAAEQAPEARVEAIYNNLPERWPELLASLGARRVAVEAEVMTHAAWTRLAEAAPDVELVPVDGWIEEARAIKEPDELERIAAACAVADRALATLLPRIVPGAGEVDLALELEWLMRTNGGDELAFEVACLGGPRAALPHGAPGDRKLVGGQVVLFDFGADVAGYHSDMTRTLFVGEPTPRDRLVYDVVARAQRAAVDLLEARLAEGGELPSGRQVHETAVAIIEEHGMWPAFGHGLGHGIGLATHERPNLGRRSPDSPLPSPTVFSVEPGIYLEGEVGVRIEDLVAIDASTGRLEYLTRFPRGVVVVGR
jgi:Xaa-Pro aminopeptidase